MTDNWEFLYEAARRLDRYQKREFAPSSPSVSSSIPGNRPGDDFNKRASWGDVLSSHGWTPVRDQGDKVYWQRPGKDGVGVSATTGHCKSILRGDLLYVFSSNALPLEVDKAYSKFEAYATLEHGGDLSAAARRLSQEGYGEQKTTFKFNRVGEGGETEHEPAQEEEVTADNVATVDDLIREGAEVKWTWEGWIQCGVLTAIAAPGGTGKTRLCADLLRRVRLGMSWPDGKPMTLPKDAIALWVVADNHHDEMVSLAVAFGIKDNIRINAPKSDPYSGVTLETLEDYAALEARIAAVRPALVIVDTVGNATDKSLSRQEEAKAFYWPLQVLARRHRTSILCLTHLNATGQFLGRRVLEKVRVAIRMEQPDPNSDKRRMEVTKSNSKRPAALGVTMGDSSNEYDNDPPASSDDTGTVSRKANNRIDECADWLLDQLSSGPKRVSNTRTEAEAAGFSTKTLYAAVGRAGVEEFLAENKKWWQVRVNESPF